MSALRRAGGIYAPPARVLDSFASSLRRAAPDSVFAAPLLAPLVPPSLPRAGEADLRFRAGGGDGDLESDLDEIEDEGEGEDLGWTAVSDDHQSLGVRLSNMSPSKLGVLTSSSCEPLARRRALPLLRKAWRASFP